jgi:poly-gamma-glutamate synthesis protein (capsule biosynthesis protein)
MNTPSYRKALAGLAFLLAYSIAGALLWLAERPVIKDFTPLPDPQVTLLAVGDIMLGRDVATASLNSDEGLLYPLTVMPELRKGVDLAFGNLESPLVSPQNQENPISSGYLFPANPAVALSLKQAGFDVVTLANNHTLDYGLEGLQDTVFSLKTAGIENIGLNKQGKPEIRYIERNRLNLAFIAATAILPAGLDENSPPIALFNPTMILEAIKEARLKADVVIVALHWGTEYQPRASENQRTFARQASEAGADLIIGSHPHVVGEFEVINHTFVAYSLGNFIFDSRYPPESRESVALYLKLDKKGVASAIAVPLKIEHERPHLLRPEEQKAGFAWLAELAIGQELSHYETVLWNGKNWEITPALAYARETNSEKPVKLPQKRVAEVFDLTEDKGGYTTGKAVENLNNEPLTRQRLELKDGTLKVWRPDETGKNWKIIWESKPGWQVEQFSFGDADEDGRPELIFTLWKNDGQDDRGEYRSHPFVYGWRRNAFRPVWAGSALVDPIREFGLLDLSGDGVNELVVLEGKYNEVRNAPARYVTVWRWMGWGYELLYRSDMGSFSGLTVIEGRPYAFYRRN